MRCSLRRAETKKLRLGSLPFRREALDLRILRERLRPYIRWKQLRVSFLQPEVCRSFVTEEDIAMPDQQLIDAHHRRFSSRIIIANNLGTRDRRAEAMRIEKWLEPFEAPFQRAHNPVFIARGEPRLPVVHPPRVAFPEHVLS